MILELKIRNIALISELTLEFGKPFTVLTGETGAGKSILLGALSLLLGERSSPDLIRTECEAASVEARFAVEALPELNNLLESHGLPACEENTLLMKRELFRNGRGKCYANGSFTTLGVLQQLGETLVDLHGQHEHQALLHREQQRNFLDEWAGLNQAREQVAGLYRQLKQSREARERLALDEAERARRLDLLAFQVKEIDEAHIQIGETETLTEERTRLAHAEKLMTTVQNVLDILHRQEGIAARDSLAQAATALAGLAGYESSMGTMADTLHSAEALLEDVITQLSDFISTFEADPQRLETIEERLAGLQKLKRKYGEAEEEILVFREHAAQEHKRLDHQDEEFGRLAQAEQKLAKELALQAHQLSQARQPAAVKLSRLVEKELKPLGFSQPVFQIQVMPREDPEGWILWEDKRYHCGLAGMDEVDFLIAPNPGEALKPVTKIASGGELSRIMLALKVVAASVTGVPTMIFDEIDAGIGGMTAEAVGKKLLALAERRQVIVITHLPQIARFADQHFQVKKQVERGRTSTLVQELNPTERVEEIARLLAGDHLTPTALQHAQELLEHK